MTKHAVIGIERNGTHIGEYTLGDQIPDSSVSKIEIYANKPLKYHELSKFLTKIENEIMDEIMNSETVPAYAGAGYACIENYVDEMISKMKKNNDIKDSDANANYYISIISSTTEANMPVQATELNQAQRSKGVCATAHS